MKTSDSENSFEDKPRKTDQDVISSEIENSSYVIEKTDEKACKTRAEDDKDAETNESVDAEKEKTDLGIEEKSEIVDQYDECDAAKKTTMNNKKPDSIEHSLVEENNKIPDNNSKKGETDHDEEIDVIESKNDVKNERDDGSMNTEETESQAV